LRWKKICIEKIRNLQGSGEKCRILSRKSEGKRDLESLGIDVIIILKWILKKYCFMTWTGFCRLTICSIVGCYEHDNEPSTSFVFSMLTECRERQTFQTIIKSHTTEIKKLKMTFQKVFLMGVNKWPNYLTAT
jgi:hypothetical protein